jgi:hypothetical protein
VASEASVARIWRKISQSCETGGVDEVAGIAEVGFALAFPWIRSIYIHI